MSQNFNLVTAASNTNSQHLFFGFRASTRTRAVVLALLVTAIAIVATMQTTPLLAKAKPAHAAANIGDIDVNNGFAELVKAVRPAVVNISVTGHTTSSNDGHGFNSDRRAPQLEEFFRRFFGEIPNLPGTPKGQHQKHNDQKPFERKTTAVGSGFIIDPSGLVVTNYHVIENADEIEVVFEDGTRVPASLQGTDKKTDLALLEINTDRELPYVVFGDSDAAEVGDWVIAIGNPFGLGGTTTSGIISARGRDIQSGPLDDFIQIDASINRGNSGGPLFNTKGEVIGVNSAIYSPNGGSVGIGFAIPASMANNVIAQLQETGEVQRGFLGVHIQTVTPEIADALGLDDASGALVSQVMKDSPAESSGIESGDVILSFDGKRIEKMRDLPKLVALTQSDKQVEIKLWRNDKVKTIKVAVASNSDEKLAQRKDNQDAESEIGLALAEVNSEAAKRFNIDQETVGVIIVDVAPNSSAAERGLKPGDVIKRVDKSAVTSREQVIAALKSSRDNNKESVLMLVERNSQSHFVVIPINT